ncbi:hypothetical protein LEMA_P037940.1 [Plenodomus lingam JN3]|uniref:Transcription factor CBF/NF-Y/archaeal histone domain-containing protein n=1 Tax=Leptosphaeria maculans (strain JN3 / isolate v23.1.3 / race Av1-4-5-6-7-8) TaxID=985895 RepID=E4ZQW5_LEPMJ|nr:hypothetical protein LEMA_P037940.1 [Plenodomus lingam JN3]CBX94120.1 hypothetical protein LEMA_P037940.1 [Plenodomus lingam JN3]
MAASAKLAYNAYPQRTSNNTRPHPISTPNSQPHRVAIPNSVPLKKMPYNNTPIAPAKEITGHVSLPRKPPSFCLSCHFQVTCMLSMSLNHPFSQHHPLQPPTNPRLTVARVQKIITADPAHLTVSKNASFAIALATEMFIQHLATTTHNVVKAERKPRRNIQYRDVSSAVSKTDNLEFLVDVVPKTTTWGAVKRGGDAARKGRADGGSNRAGKRGAGLAEAENGEGEDDANVLPSRENQTLEQRIDQHTSASASASAALTNGHKSDDAMDIDTHTSHDHHRPQSQPQPHHQNPPIDQDETDTEDDPAAMQLEMEMRGPPQQNHVVQPTTQQPQTQTHNVRRTSGFTAINGVK